MKRSGGRLCANRRNYSGGKERRAIKKRTEASRSIVHGSSLSYPTENQRNFPNIPYNATWMATICRRQKKPGTLKVSGNHCPL
jgi:hypothetical protein